jgi:hypothetical protein
MPFMPRGAAVSAQHVRSGSRIEERFVTGVVPPDDVVLRAGVDPHFEDLAFPRLVADMNCVDDQLVTDFRVHPDLRIGAHL